MKPDVTGRKHFVALRRQWEEAYRDFVTQSRVVLISTNADQRVAVPAVPESDLEAWEVAKDRLDEADAALRRAFRGRTVERRLVAATGREEPALAPSGSSVEPQPLGFDSC